MICWSMADTSFWAILSNSNPNVAELWKPHNALGPWDNHSSSSLSAQGMAILEGNVEMQQDFKKVERRKVSENVPLASCICQVNYASTKIIDDHQLNTTPKIILSIKLPWINCLNCEP